MYVCMYVCMHVCMYVRMYTYTYRYMHVYASAPTHAHFKRTDKDRQMIFLNMGGSENGAPPKRSPILCDPCCKDSQNGVPNFIKLPYVFPCYSSSHLSDRDPRPTTGPLHLHCRTARASEINVNRDDPLRTLDPFWISYILIYSI